MTKTDVLCGFASEDLQDYEIEIRIRNARILGLMRRAGIANVNALFRKSGVHPGMISDLLNLRTTPFHSQSPNYKPAVRKLADALNCHPDDMFSDRQRTSFLANNRKAVEVSEAEVEGQLARLERASPDEVVRMSEQKTLLRETLKSLPPRMRVVLSLRFGLDGHERTFDEIAEQIGVSKERVRQIEMKALKHLRNGYRGKILAGVVDFPAKPTVLPRWNPPTHAAPSAPAAPAAPAVARPAPVIARPLVDAIDRFSIEAKERWLRATPK